MCLKNQIRCISKKKQKFKIAKTSFKHYWRQSYFEKYPKKCLSEKKISELIGLNTKYSRHVYYNLHTIFKNIANF